MKSERQRQAEQYTGSSSDLDNQQFEQAQRKEAERKAKEQRRIEELAGSNSYELIETIKTWMDDYYLDGILGLIGVGDILVLLLGLPTIYFSMFKLHSIRLTVICIGYFIIDMLVGAVPMLGDIADFFYKGYKKSYNLIDGYIHNDPQTMHTINRRFGIILCSMIAVIALYGFILYSMLRLFGAAINLFH